MVFIPKTELKPENLPDHVICRFAEVELSMIISTITQLNQNLYGLTGANELAIVQVLDMLMAQDHPDRQKLSNALISRKFPPSRTEMSHCLLYGGASTREAARIAGISTQTVQKNRDVYPSYRPVYDGWNRDLFQKLNVIREAYNIHQHAGPYTNLPLFDLEPYKVDAFFKAEAKSQQQQKEAAILTPKVEHPDIDDSQPTDEIIWD